MLTRIPTTNRGDREQTAGGQRAGLAGERAGGLRCTQIQSHHSYPLRTRAYATTRKKRPLPEEPGNWEPEAAGLMMMLLLRTGAVQCSAAMVKQLCR